MSVQSNASAGDESIGSAQDKPVVGGSSANLPSDAAVGDNKPQSAPAGVSGNAPKQSFFHRVRWFFLLVCVVAILLIIISFLNFPGFISRLSPGLIGKMPVATPKNLVEFVPPVNVADINFPSGFQQEIFLKNFQEAGKTTDYAARYKLLEDDYTRLLGFYTQDHSAKTRKTLEQYSTYMINNYPDLAQKNIYTVPCYDSGCGTANYPEEIKNIKSEIAASKTLDKSLKESLVKDFEAAALSGSKETQFSYYEQVFQSIKSSYEKTKDDSLKEIAVKLRDFIKASYGDLYNAYLKNKSDLFDI